MNVMNIPWKKVSFAEKNDQLIGEFNDYLSDHWDLLDELPRNISIAVTVRGDDKFSEQSLSLVKRNGPKDVPIIVARKEGRRWVVRPLRENLA